MPRAKTTPTVGTAPDGAWQFERYRPTPANAFTTRTVYLTG
jgi:hypothetical protein